MDIDPSTSRSQQCGQQGTNGEAVVVDPRGNVPGRAEGAVEITQEKGGNLHVEAVGQLQQGQDEASPLGGLSLERGVKGDQRKAMRQPGARGKLNGSHRATHDVEHPKAAKGTEGKLVHERLVQKMIARSTSEQSIPAHVSKAHLQNA